MAGVIRIDFVNMLEPGAGLSSVARQDPRRPVMVEASHIRSADPAAIDDQAILDQHGIAWDPGHLFHRPVLVEPSARRDGDRLPSVVFLRPAAFVEYRYAWQPAIYRRLCPRLPAGREDVDVARHVSHEVIDRDAA